jgi:mono/diheme cytochrome c family protein
MWQMMQSMMSGVVTPGIRPEDLPDPKSAGAKLVAENCAQCHNLPSPAMHSAEEWPAVADWMFRREEMMTSMGGGGMMGGRGMMGGVTIQVPTPKEQDEIVAYLKKHAFMSVKAAAIPSPRSKGALLFAANCARCHALPNPAAHTAAEWPAVVAKMQTFMKAMGKPEITPEENREILRYLEKHARS